MPCLDEAQVEFVTVEYCRGLIYGYHHGSVFAPDSAAPERPDYGHVVLILRLRATELVLEQVEVLCKDWTEGRGSGLGGPGGLPHRDSHRTVYEKQVKNFRKQSEIA